MQRSGGRRNWGVAGSYMVFFDQAGVGGLAIISLCGCVGLVALVSKNYAWYIRDIRGYIRGLSVAVTT